MAVLSERHIPASRNSMKTIFEEHRTNQSKVGHRRSSRHSRRYNIRPSCVIRIYTFHSLRSSSGLLSVVCLACSAVISRAAAIWHCLRICGEGTKKARSLDAPPQPRLDLRRLFRFHRCQDTKAFPTVNYFPLFKLTPVISQLRRTK
jgi:hypothetical protein